MISSGEIPLIRDNTLVQRHATQVNAAYQKVWAEGAPDYLRGRLPPSSLLGRIGQLEHRREPWQRLADRIAGLVAPALRKAFAATRPTVETDVQREIDVAVTAAESNLIREFPTVSFGPVGTRPDFSSDKSADNPGEPELFVEVKLVKQRSDVRRVTDEILADIPKYAARARSALFLIYDGGGFVADEESFAAMFERIGPVRVRVLRH